MEHQRTIRDQAQSLREINFLKKKNVHSGLTRVISFTSGKGGVGKTSSVVNLAISLAKEGRSVLVLDADLGLANVDVLLGVRPMHTLHDVIEGKKRLAEIIVDGPHGISIIPAASGIESICSLDIHQRMMLVEEVESVAAKFDYLLIDTRAGIGPDVMHFNAAAQEIVCIITPEPTSLTDAYAMIKVLALNYAERSVSIIANNCGHGKNSAESEAKTAFTRLQKAVDRFLQIELKYLGHIPADTAVGEAVRNQKAVTDIFPSSPAGLAYAALARRVDNDFVNVRVKGGMQFFFQQLLEVNAHGG